VQRWRHPWPRPLALLWPQQPQQPQRYAAAPHPWLAHLPQAAAVVAELARPPWHGGWGQLLAPLLEPLLAPLLAPLLVPVLAPLLEPLLAPLLEPLLAPLLEQRLLRPALLVR
jgi:hypothetical protein